MILMLLGACGGPSRADTGDTASIDGAVSIQSGWDWRPVIEQLYMDCSDTGLSVDAYTRGVTNATLWLDLIDSSAAHSESHSIRTVVTSRDGFWEYLRGDFAVGAPEMERGVATTFRCEDLLAVPPVLTFVARTMTIRIDLPQIPECLTWGHDPVGVTAGAYDDLVATPYGAPDELRDCRIGLPPLMVSP